MPPSAAREQRQLFDLPLEHRERMLVGNGRAIAIGAGSAVAHAAALGWWEAQTGRRGIPGLPPVAFPSAAQLPTLPPSLALEARAYGRDLAQGSIIDGSAALGRLYTHALPAEHRAAYGIYYTPPLLVAHLMNRAERAGHRWTRGTTLDPSCGGGAFLVEAANRISRALAGADPAIILTALASRLRGWDVDPFATWLANLSVETSILPLIAQTGRRLGAIAEVRDALGEFADETGRYDLVVGNPPFGKIKDTPSIRARFKRGLYGHPNLYGLFTDLAVHLAQPAGGIIAYLTPASYLAGRYFKALRRMLREHTQPVDLDIVESRKDVFGDVLQEVVLSTFRRRAGQRGTGRRATKCAVVHVDRQGLSVQPTGRMALPVDLEAPWTLPRSVDDASFVSRLHQMPSRLRDWGYGVSTGPLVWNRHKTRLHREPGPGRVPIVWAEAVTQDGRFVLRATKRNHAPWFAPSHPKDPNLVRQACVLVQRTTAKEQHRRLICAEISSDLINRVGGIVSVENHLNMVRPSSNSPAVPLSVLHAFLSTTTADRVLRCINASVAVSASELEAMPLPDAADVIAAMSAADPEAAVRRLYGLLV